MNATVSTDYGTAQGEVLSTESAGTTSIRTIYGQILVKSDLDGVFRPA